MMMMMMKHQLLLLCLLLHLQIHQPMTMTSIKILL
jgi:hypothetical protein